MTTKPLYSAILDLIQDVIITLDKHGAITGVSRSATRHLGYAGSQWDSLHLHDLLDGVTSPMQSLNPTPQLARMRRADGSLWNCRLVAQPLPEASQTVLVATAIGSSDADAVTKLASRGEFDRHLQLLIDRQVEDVGCFFIDLDHFKRINDVFGHLVGDEVLRVVAKRVRACFRPRDFVARYGGDEFIAVVDPCGPSVAKTIGDRLLRSVCTMVECHGHQVDVSASIGVACGTAAMDLIARADQAMYTAKAGGRQQLATNEALPNYPR